MDDTSNKSHSVELSYSIKTNDLPAAKDDKLSRLKSHTQSENDKKTDEEQEEQQTEYNDEMIADRPPEEITAEETAAKAEPTEEPEATEPPTPEKEAKQTKKTSARKAPVKRPKGSKFLVPAEALVELTDQFVDLEKFVKRRFDELSMEVNATSQQVDFAEEEMSRRFGEVLDIVDAVSFQGTGDTAANTGVELSAVIDVTEKSANTIIDAAEHIQSLFTTVETLQSDDTKALRQAVEEKIQTIITACEFQDITGQRIQKAVENLNKMSDQINITLDKLGIEIKEEDRQGDQTAKLDANISSQDDIDALFD